MSVAVKGKRKLDVHGRKFLWLVAEDLDEAGALALNVVSDDRKVLLRYHLSQTDDTRFIIVIGPEFKGIAGCGGAWRRFRCPRFATSDAVTPRHVRELIDWATSTDSAPPEFDWLGTPIGDG